MRETFDYVYLDSSSVLLLLHTWSDGEPVLPFEVLGLVDRHQSGALVLDQSERLVQPFVVKVGGGEAEEDAVRVVG